MSASAAEVGRKVICADGWRVTMHIEVRRGPLQGPNSERQGPTNRMSAAMFSGSPHSTRATISDRPSAKSHQKQPTKRPNAKVNAVSQHQDQPFREMQHGRHRRHCSPGHHRTLPRGVMITLPQGDLLKDSGILRTAAQHNGVNVGIYASVINGGRNRRGDTVGLA